jgi:hypothetical protein
VELPPPPAAIVYVPYADFEPPPDPTGVLGYCLSNPSVYAAIKRLPSSGLRMLLQPLSVFAMLDAIKMGVDLFDGDLPDLMSTFGYAAAFLITPSPGVMRASLGQPGFDAGGPFAAEAASDAATAPEGLGSVEAESSVKGGTARGGVMRREQLERGFSGVGNVTENVAARGAALLSGDRTKMRMTDKIYASDMRPLVPGCGCFTCSGTTMWAPEDLPPPGRDGVRATHPGHSRAYIHHLLVCEEILGQTLLLAHNTHMLAHFFTTVRQAILDDKLEEYTDWFKSANLFREES